MTKLFAFCSFLFLYVSSYGQNLVPNPSFEEYENGCPETFNEMPIGWEWWRQSPNSFNTCVVPESASDSLGWAPNNGFGYQVPFDGDSYIGFLGYGSNAMPEYREYIGIELSHPLIIGEEYWVSFRSSLGVFANWDMRWACSHIGALFTDRSYTWKIDELEVPNFAHVYTEEIITDTTNWVEIQGSFIADQEYTHMGLGVFFDSSVVDTLHLFGPTSLGAYYYVDYVCVSTSPDCLDNSSRKEIDVEVDMKLVNSELLISSMLSEYSTEIYSLDGKLILYKDKLSYSESIRLSDSYINNILFIKINHGKGSVSKKVLFMSEF